MAPLMEQKPKQRYNGSMIAANSTNNITRARRRRDDDSSDEHRRALLFLRPSRRRRGGKIAESATRTTLVTAFLFLSLLFLLGGANAKSNNLLRSENVFGWQKEPSRQQQLSTKSRRHSLSSISPGPIQTTTTSPLRRSENVFGWQKQNTPPSSRRRRSNSNDKKRSIINISYNNEGGKNYYSHNEKDSKTNIKQLNIPPNINVKLQPRKKELWLPWPLGSLRNDFHRFAIEQQQRNDRQSSTPQHQSQQQRLKNYYCDDEGYHQQESNNNNNVFNQGREWATKLLQRGELMFKGTIIGGGGGGGGDVVDKEMETNHQQPQSGYWIKDMTTPMATASATMGKKDSSSKNNKNSRRYGKVDENNDENNSSSSNDDSSSSDRDVLFQYLKLQASIRLRQLGYVGSDFSVHLPPASPTLLLLYMLPTKQDPLRRLVKFTMTSAAVSWMHSEATKYRRLAPLPVMRGCNVREPNLPPFLPEVREVVVKEDEKKKSSSIDVVMISDNKDKEDSSGGGNSKSSSKARAEEKGPKVDQGSNDNDDDSSSSTQQLPSLLPLMQTPDMH